MDTATTKTTGLRFPIPQFSLTRMLSVVSLFCTSAGCLALAHQLGLFGFVYASILLFASTIGILTKRFLVSFLLISVIGIVWPHPRVRWSGMIHSAEVQFTFVDESHKPISGVTVSESYGPRGGRHFMDLLFGIELSELRSNRNGQLTFRVIGRQTGGTYREAFGIIPIGNDSGPNNWLHFQHPEYREISISYSSLFPKGKRLPQNYETIVVTLGDGSELQIPSFDKTVIMIR